MFFGGAYSHGLGGFGQYVAPAAGLPEIVNGSFEGSANPWVDNGAGGSAQISIVVGTPGHIAFVGGTNVAGHYVSQTLSGLGGYAGQTATIQFEILASSEVQPPAFALGSTAATSAASVAVGVQTVDVIIGSENEQIRVKGSGTASATWSVTDISITEITALGPELIVNGDMSSETGWTLEPEDGTLVIAGGVMDAVVGDDSSNAFQTPALAAAATYRVAGTVSATSGTLEIYVGGEIGTDITVPGAFSQDIVAGAEDTVQVRFVAGSTVTLDEISCKEVI